MNEKVRLAAEKISPIVDGVSRGLDRLFQALLRGLKSLMSAAASKATERKAQAEAAMPASAPQTAEERAQAATAAPPAPATAPEALVTPVACHIVNVLVIIGYVVGTIMFLYGLCRWATTSSRDYYRITEKAGYFLLCGQGLGVILSSAFMNLLTIMASRLHWLYRLSVRQTLLLEARPQLQDAPAVPAEAAPAEAVPAEAVPAMAEAGEAGN